ncbi:MAG TPA: xanthine dehydrogenase family protein molybdopterin-binding subunit [Burkholderiales bacterium]|nr:xanthine dehydrogenase family protein molybdopterin-binding subunit [Burkholderiales bacterium]
MNEGIGARVLRKEDLRFLTGRGNFVADCAVADALHCAIVRSPHAHARIRSIDVAAAESAPGVVAVLVGADMAADGVGPMRSLWAIRSHNGEPMAEPPRWALARERVRHVGEPVAIVLAENQGAALDAAERVDVDYEPLPAVTASVDALADVAPQLHADAPGNVCFRWQRGDAAAVERAFAQAAHTVELQLHNNRLAGCAIEPRAAIALPGSDGDSLTLYSATQVPHFVRRLVAEQLGMAELAIRVIAPDVGGGFGYKGKHYPEETIVAWAARRLRRPVRWVATRTESFVSDNQARDHFTRCALALDAGGRFLGLRVETVANLGAYVSTVGAAIPSAIYTALLAGVYATPAIHASVTGVFTSTVPTDAYRGAGRPEACFVLERLADEAARLLGIDRAEIRRRNLVPPSAMPYKTPIGPTYDCGDFPRIFARALALADYDGFDERRATASARGVLRGVGIACFVESSGVAPSKLAGALGARAGFFESAEVRVDSTGAVQASLGTHSHGQGHATTFAQVLASRLGMPLAKIRIVEGDTAAVPYGTGTFGSRSLAVGGSALHMAAHKIIEKGRRIAAHRLEAADADVALAQGRFVVKGTDRGIAFAEVARAAHTAHDLPSGMEPGLQESAFYDPSNFAFSNGVHLCEVEIDPETGVTRVVGYWAVDDVGTVVNPMIVEGQLHGAVAQGAGQALGETCVYDAGGQLVSASFLDYSVPRADDFPEPRSENDESQPCTHNPLGAKGCGEAGTIAAPAAIVNAILDALAPLGVDEIEMPATPHRVWQAIVRARREQAAAG